MSQALKSAMASGSQRSASHVNHWPISGPSARFAKRQAELTEDYDRAKRDLDLAAQDRIVREQEALITYLRQVAFPSGKCLRTFRDNYSRANRRNIARVFEKLDTAGLRELANHLRQHIHIDGRDVTYRPTDRVHWHF